MLLYNRVRVKMNKQLKIVLDELERKTANKIEECYLRITDDVKNLINECFQSTVKDIENIWLQNRAEMENVCTESFPMSKAGPMVDTHKDLIIPKIELKYETQQSTEQSKPFSESTYQIRQVVEETTTVENNEINDGICYINSAMERKNNDLRSIESYTIDDPNRRRTLITKVGGEGIAKFFECNICTFRASTYNRVNVHYKSKHKDKSTYLSDYYRCPKCSFVSRGLSNISRHMSSCHYQTNTSKCPKCFRDLTVYEQVMNTHSCSI